MFSSGFKSYGPGRRKDSAIRRLVAETLVLAKTHGCVEKIENELEEELRRESTGQDNDPLSKWRRKGDKALKSKYVLLTVALFCVTDCALVLGELILDLHRVKDTLETSERTIQEFKLTLKKMYPTHITDIDTDIKEVFDLISRSTIIWHEGSQPSSAGNHTTTSVSSTAFPPPHRSHVTTGRNSRTAVTSSSFAPAIHNVIPVRRRRSWDREVQVETEYVVVSSKDTVQTSSPNNGSHTDLGQRGKSGQRILSLEEEVAHALHLTSVTLMAILLAESMLKAFCAGLSFFKRKLETFDLFVVVVSFIVDIVFMQILPRFKIQDFVFILAFLLPWRVIRVVNSLVVAVQDHEHFRLKMVYSRKKKIQNSLRETEIKLQLFRAQCCALRRLCLSEGVEEAKVDEIVQLDEYGFNRPAKTKCKVKIDSSPVSLHDRSDFVNTSSPGPSTAGQLTKKHSLQPDSALTPPACDRYIQRNGHSPLMLAETHQRSGGFKAKARKLSVSFSNGPLGSLFGPRQLQSVPEASPMNGTIRHASSHNQIFQVIKQDVLPLEGAKRSRAGSPSGVGHVSVRGQGQDDMSLPVPLRRQLGGSLQDLPVVDRTIPGSLPHLRVQSPHEHGVGDGPSRIADSEVSVVDPHGEEAVVHLENVSDQHESHSDVTNSGISHPPLTSQHRHSALPVDHSHSRPASPDGAGPMDLPQHLKGEPVAVTSEVLSSPETETAAIILAKCKQTPGSDPLNAGVELDPAHHSATQLSDELSTDSCDFLQQSESVAHLEASSEAVVSADPKDDNCGVLTSCLSGKTSGVLVGISDRVHGDSDSGQTAKGLDDLGSDHNPVTSVTVGSDSPDD